MSGAILSSLLFSSKALQASSRVNLVQNVFFATLDLYHHAPLPASLMFPVTNMHVSILRSLILYPRCMHCHPTSLLSLLPGKLVDKSCQNFSFTMFQFLLNRTTSPHIISVYVRPSWHSLVHCLLKPHTFPPDLRPKHWDPLLLS